MARNLKPGEFVKWWGYLAQVTRKHQSSLNADLVYLERRRDGPAKLQRTRWVYVGRLQRHEPTPEELQEFLLASLEI
jgi:hypothetical protein